MVNLNELAYGLKEQGLSYIQIGFVLKDQEGRKELCSASSPGKRSFRDMVKDKVVFTSTRTCHNTLEYHIVCKQN